MNRDWYISPSGNDDTGDGSIENPYRTINHVTSSSNYDTSPGDTIVLRAGTYNEPQDVRFRKQFHLRQHPGEHAHVHVAVDYPDSCVFYLDPPAAGSTIIGEPDNRLEISGSQFYGIKMNGDWSNGGPADAATCDNVYVEHVFMHDTGRDAIKIVPHVKNFTLRNFEIARTGAAEAPGTPVDDRNADGVDCVCGYNVLIEHGYIHDISTTGVYFKGGSSGCIARYLRIENCGMGGILLGFDTSVEYFDTTDNPGYYEAIDCHAYNNTIINTVWEGLGYYAAKNCTMDFNTVVNTARDGHSGLYYGTPVQDWDANAGRPSTVNSTMRNNILIQSGGMCVEIRYWNELGGVSALAGRPLMDNNLYWDTAGPCKFADNRPEAPYELHDNNGTQGGNFDLWRSVEQCDAHTLMVACQVDATGHLFAGSPAIGAGQAVAGIVDDIDGDARGNPPSIGADEPGTGGGGTPPANVPPVAAFTCAVVGRVATFTDTSTDADGSIVTRAWSFGDGGTATTANPVHTFAAAGTYTVALTVTDNAGGSNTVSQPVAIAAAGGGKNQPPVAKMQIDLTDIPGFVYFSNNSTDADGTIVASLWDFGDGNTSAARDASHTYAPSASAVTYAVTLTVTDDDQATGTVSGTVTIPGTAGNVCTNAHPAQTPLCPDGSHQLGGTWVQAPYPDCSWAYQGGSCPVVPPTGVPIVTLTPILQWSTSAGTTHGSENDAVQAATNAALAAPGTTVTVSLLARSVTASIG